MTVQGDFFSLKPQNCVCLLHTLLSLFTAHKERRFLFYSRGLSCPSETASLVDIRDSFQIEVKGISSNLFP